MKTHVRSSISCTLERLPGIEILILSMLSLPGYHVYDNELEHKYTENECINLVRMA